MTRYLTLEDWIALVFGYVEDFTVQDLLEFNASLAHQALAAAAATAGGFDLFEDVHDKAASTLIEMLHLGPLRDAARNREVAALTAMYFLSLNGHEWRPPQDELPYWIAEAEAGRLSVRTLGQGIAQHCTP